MNVLVEEQCLRDIAKAIRKKNGKTRTYKPREMALAIESLEMQTTKKYYVYITQSNNQTITAMYNGTSYTNTFSAYENSRITFSIKANSGYTAGTLNYTVISNLNSDVTVKATPATLATPKVNYIGKTFYISDGNASIKYCKFREIDETFRINIGSSGLTVSGNEKFQQFLKNSRNVYFDYWGVKIATFNNSSKAQTYDYNMLRNFASGTEMTVQG